jgi:DNA repair protein RecO (recombination protein O)
MNLNLQPAYVLHYRNYRETSFLVELLTKHAGRISVIARGAKRAKSPMKGLIQPFIPIAVAWRGKGSLPTLQTAEICGKPIALHDDKLFSGFYLNELLMYILHRHSPCESIFILYENVLHELSFATAAEPILRKFEKYLLSELGYALQFNHEAHSDITIKANKHYLFIPHEGFSSIQAIKLTQNDHAIFTGKNLLKIAADDFTDVEVLRDAKRLMRFALQPLLGSKQIKSRELFK